MRRLNIARSLRPVQKTLRQIWGKRCRSRWFLSANDRAAAPLSSCSDARRGWELRMLQIQAFAPNNWEDLERFQEKMPI